MTRRIRTLPDGRNLVVTQLGGGAWVLQVYEGAHGNKFPLDEWFYPDATSAMQAWYIWEGVGEPEGWKHHYATRRSRPEREA